MSNSENPTTSTSTSVATATRVGIDLGTSQSVMAVSRDGERLPLQTDVVRSVVGYPKEGIIPGILPGDTEVMFGDEAIEYRLHLDLKWPLEEGCIADPKSGVTFCSHLREHLGEGPHWGVVGAPANCTASQQKDLRSAMVGVLDHILIVPEPFLAAMGLRDDPGFRKDGNNSDPTKHSLIVDIGAGTTDLCLVRGYYPTADDQISFPRAGNYIDELLSKAVVRRYPDLKLTRVTLNQLKEAHSFVGGFDRDVKVKVYVGRPPEDR